MAERTVYILLTRSGTWFSRLIHFATQDDYTHASIGLAGPNGPFYSFARKKPHFTLPAGLVEERLSPRRCVPCCLYALQVSDQTYARLQARLWKMYRRREHYHYSLLGALACFLNLPLQRRRHYFCSQFVADLLESCHAVELPKPPTLVRPADFCSMQCLTPVHRGFLAGLSSFETA